MGSLSPRALIGLVVGGALLVAGSIAAPVLLWRRAVDPLRPLSARAPEAPTPDGLPETSDPRRLDARALFRAGNLEAAVAAYEALHREAPAEAGLAGEFARALAARAARLAAAGALDAAAGLAERAARLAPQDSSVVDLFADVAIRRAEAQAEADRPDHALETLRAAVRVAPGHATLHALLGRALYEHEDLEGARLHLDRARALAPAAPLASGVASLLEQVEKEASASTGFRSADIGRYVIRYEGFAGPDVGERLRQVMPGVEAQVRNRLGFAPAWPLNLICYGHERLRTNWDLPDWAGGFYDGKIRLPIAAVEEGGGRLERILLHETAHAAVAGIAGGGEVPIWIHEGVAQWAEHGGLAPGARETAGRALAEGSWVPVDRLQAPFLSMGPDAARIAYAEAAVAVGLMVERYGAGALDRLVRGAATGGAEAGIRAATGLDADAFDQALRASLGG